MATGWGGNHNTKVTDLPGAVGTMAEIEAANKALDSVGVPPGNLAGRVAVLVARYRSRLPGHVDT